MTKNNSITEKVEEVAIWGIEERLTGIPRSPKCYLSSKDKMCITYAC